MMKCLTSFFEGNSSIPLNKEYAFMTVFWNVPRGEYRRKFRKDILVGLCRALQQFMKICANCHPQDQCWTEEQGVLSNNLTPAFLNWFLAQQICQCRGYVYSLWRTFRLNQHSGPKFGIQFFCHIRTNNLG